jgi:SAM-dependent methyltransferase
MDSTMKFEVMTSWPVATESVDHLFPRGTKNDNSTHLEFNRRLVDLLRDLCGCVPKVLDLGCAGGGFVESIRSLHVGTIAVGLEGSSYSDVHKRAEWARWGGVRLFTADIAKPFVVLQGGRPATFNVVTMWEVLEHLTVAELEAVNVNILAHLKVGGLFMGSVNTESDHFEGHEYHQTIRDFSWWHDFFVYRGWRFRPDLADRFETHWVRGPRTDGPSSHNFVFQR